MSDATAHNQFSRLLDRAMRILALRDHSEAEFRHKLSLSVARSAMYAKEHAQVPPTPEQIDRVVVWCYENHYLDDAHFAERFVASRSRKGYGPQRIRMELEHKGVDRTLTDDALASAEIDWSRQAREVAERKFWPTIAGKLARKSQSAALSDDERLLFCRYSQHFFKF